MRNFGNFEIKGMSREKILQQSRSAMTWTLPHFYYRSGTSTALLTNL